MYPVKKLSVANSYCVCDPVYVSEKLIKEKRRGQSLEVFQNNYKNSVWQTKIGYIHEREKEQQMSIMALTHVNIKL